MNTPTPHSTPTLAETPRSDPRVVTFLTDDAREWVDAGHARTLERELQAANERAERLEKELAAVQLRSINHAVAWTDECDTVSRLTAENAKLKGAFRAYQAAANADLRPGVSLETIIREMYHENAALKKEVERLTSPVYLDMVLTKLRQHGKSVAPLAAAKAKADGLLAIIDRAEKATMYECTCGGNPPYNPKCCPACKVYHRIRFAIDEHKGEPTDS